MVAFNSSFMMFVASSVTFLSFCVFGTIANGQSLYECSGYDNGAVSGSEMYCLMTFGKARICIPYTTPCSDYYGESTNSCIATTKSPTNKPTDQTASPTQPTISPTTPTVSLPPTSSTCACTAYFNGAVQGSSAYCSQQFGTSQFCYPAQTPCQNQNGIPTNNCIATTISPTKSPVSAGQQTCQCGMHMEGAIPSTTSSYCYQMLGVTMLCYPDTSPCTFRNGLSTTRCLPAAKPSLLPTKTPSSAPITTVPSKSPTKSIPTTRTPTKRPVPTMKPTTAKPGVTQKPSSPTPPTVPTMSPTQKPTQKSGLTPIAGLIIFLIVAFILFGGYQYAMEKRKERKNKIQAEQQQQQQQQQDLSPVSVI